MIAAGKRWVIHKSRSDTIRLWPIGDFHLMHRGCEEDRLRRDIAEIAKDPYSFAIGMGDYAEFIGYQDKRFDPEAVAESVSVKELGALGKVGMARTHDMLKPIKHKLLGLMKGNHEKRYEVHQQQENLHGWLCTELDTPDLGFSCFVDLVFRREGKHPTPNLLFGLPPGSAKHGEWAVRVFAHHGAGYANTPGGKLNRLIQFMDYFDADLTLVAHVHDKEAKRLVRLSANRECTKIAERPQLGVITGSYLRAYAPDVTSYAEQRGYRPTPLGAVCVEITPDRRQIRVAI